MIIIIAKLIMMRGSMDHLKWMSFLLKLYSRVRKSSRPSFEDLFCA